MSDIMSTRIHYFIKFEDMFLVITFVQRILGIEQFFNKVNNRNSIGNILKRLYFVILCINLAFNTASAMYNSINILASKDKERYFDAAELLPCGMITLLVYFKMFRIIFNTKHVVTLLQDLKDYWIEEDASDEIQKIVRSNLSPVIKLVKFYTIHTVFNIVAFFSSPFVIAFLFPSGVEEKVVPFKLVYPFQYQQSWFLYFMVLLSQFLAVFLTALSMAMFDCFIITVIVQLATHFEVLSERLRSLPHLVSEPSLREIFAINNGIDTILQKHMQIIGLCQLTQKILGPVFLAIFLLSSILICQMLFIITLAPLDKQMNFVGMLLSLLVQIFLICYYGNKIVEKSVLMCDAVYAVDWYNSDRSFKSKVLVLQQRAQRPVSLNALAYAQVSLSTFSSIMNTSYSYFTLLQTAADGTDI